MNKYRKIWESINGPIPKDHNGKSYEIHHIDGDRTNNHISNLRLVTMQEHYEIHYNQGDYGACQAIAMRMNLMVDDLSEKCSKLAKLRVLTGTHNLTGDRNPIHDRVQDGTHGKWLSERNATLFKQGKHNFQKRPDGTSISSDKVKNGTHNFTYDFCKESWLKSAEIQKEMKSNGTHHSCIEKECPHCGKIGKGHAMFRWHFDNCKEKPI